MNEFIFIIHSFILSISALLCLRLGSAALTVFLSLTTLLANLLVAKQIGLAGFIVTATDAYIIGATLCMNLLQEYYGSKAARNALYLSFGALALTTILVQLHLLYMPAACDSTHAYFQAILGSTPRILIASLVSFFLSQNLDRLLFGVLKQQFPQTPLAYRFYASAFISQAFDTVFFTFFGLYGILDHIFDVMLVSFIVKTAAMLIVSPALWLSRFIANPLRTHEPTV